MMGNMPQNHNSSSEAVTGEIAPEPDSPDYQSASLKDDAIHNEFIWHYSDDINFEHILVVPQWAPYFDEALKADLKMLVEFVNGVVELEGLTICCRFTDDKEIRQLNREFRDKDKATNVLSFPDGQDGRLGDLAFAFETMFYKIF